MSGGKETLKAVCTLLRYQYLSQFFQLIFPISPIDRRQNERDERWERNLEVGVCAIQISKFSVCKI